MANYIGLDIKKNTLRFASVKKQDEQLIVTNYDEVIVEGNLYKPSLTQPTQLKDEMRALFNQHKLKQDYIIYSDFGFNLLIKNTKIIESLNKDKVREAVFMELGSSISVPFEEMTFDILSAKATEKQVSEPEEKGKLKKKQSKQSEKVEQEANIVVANEKDLIYVGDAITESNNIPYAVEMSALAYHRLFSHFSSQKMKRNMYLLLELNCGEAVMTVMHKGVPIYTQYAEYNPDHWKTELASQTKRSWIEEWSFDEVYERNKLLSTIDSINRMINTFSNMSSGSGIKYVMLVGENPLIDYGVSDFLSEHVDVPVVPANLNIVDKRGKSIPKRFYKAAGLGLKKEELI
ncbi:MAG: hypothetical protein RR494_08855 [Vagococcus sp.]|uniref:type IV pilus biogenesis protein PilM n=1 Tax=Vagococcus TaxID=2737 RepID=UPI002FC9119A